MIDDVITLEKGFSTYHDAQKWVNKQLSDLSYKVYFVDIKRPHRPNAPIVATVVFRKQ